MFSTDAEFNGLSSVIYRNEILQSHLKILAKIQLSVICTHIVDFRRPGYIWYHWFTDMQLLVVLLYLYKLLPVITTSSTVNCVSELLKR